MAGCPQANSGTFRWVPSITSEKAFLRFIEENPDIRTQQVDGEVEVHTADLLAMWGETLKAEVAARKGGRRQKREGLLELDRKMKDEGASDKQVAGRFNQGYPLDSDKRVTVRALQNARNYANRKDA